MNSFKLTPILLILLISALSLGCTSKNTPQNEGTASNNIPPLANGGKDFQVSVNQEFSFNGDASDRDGRIVLYEWDVDGDGIYDTSCQMCAKDKHSYDKPGIYKATLKVTDDQGKTDTDTITITVK